MPIPIVVLCHIASPTSVLCDTWCPMMVCDKQYTLCYQDGFIEKETVRSCYGEPLHCRHHLLVAFANRQNTHSCRLPLYWYVAADATEVGAASHHELPLSDFVRNTESLLQLMSSTDSITGLSREHVMCLLPDGSLFYRLEKKYASKHP